MPAASTICRRDDTTPLSRIEDAVRVMIEAIGDDVSREGLLDTPKRVARAFWDLSLGHRGSASSEFGSAFFSEPILSQDNPGTIIVRDITFASLCDCTLLPFFGRCHVAYIPGAAVVLGLSKLARVARFCAKKVQQPNNLAKSILLALVSELCCKGAAVIIERESGVGVPPSSEDTHVTACATGVFSDESLGLLQELLFTLRLHKRSGFSVEHVPEDECHPELLAPCPNLAAPCAHESKKHCIQPSAMIHVYARDQTDAQQADVPLILPSISKRDIASMESAVVDILSQIGMNALPQALLATARRYCTWLLNATSGYAASVPGKQGACSPSCPLPEPGPMSDLLHPCVPVQNGLKPYLWPVSTSQTITVGNDGWHVYLSSFTSLCEHHMLPFSGKICVAYIPQGNAKPIAEQWLLHVVAVYARRLQVQERLTQQVADALQSLVSSLGVMVACEAKHMCMVARGVESHSSSTITTATQGRFQTDVHSRMHVLEMLNDYAC